MDDFLLKPKRISGLPEMARRLLAVISLCLSILTPLHAAENYIVMQSTTSAKNSGLFDHILPIFKAETGIEVRVVAVGTGQAIRNAANGDGDVLLVHSREAEEQFIADGFGVKRYDVMYNDFVIVGPPDDPAKIAGSDDALWALRQIALGEHDFMSRGDDSGTHRAERRLWESLGISPSARHQRWYKETGSGMGSTLNIAVGIAAYTLTDRGTWLAFKNKQDHLIFVQGDPLLFNQYGIIAVNPERHPHVNSESAQRFIEWIRSDVGQRAIADHQIEGQSLFSPNAVAAHVQN